MKKLLLLCFVLTLTTVAFADKKTTGCSASTAPKGDITFFGIDYSLVRFAGIKESSAHALFILPEINSLFVAEEKKYDVEGYMKRRVVKKDFDYVTMVTKKLVADSLITESAAYQLNVDDIKSTILKYPDSEEAGIGLVFIAELMNKNNAKGSYYVTFFDLKTKAILSTCKVLGKAGGFGLRNYWAGSMYDVMKRWDDTALYY